MELLEERFTRLLHLWLDAGYNGKGKGRDYWAEKALGFSVEVVRPPRRWVWVPADQEPPPRPAFTVLPRSPTEEMGGREDVLLARPEPQAEQGLRAAAGELGGVRIHCDDASDGEEVSPLVRLFRRFLRLSFWDYSDFLDSLWSSTLAIWPCNTPQRLGLLQRPLRLFAGRYERVTRKKSP